MHFFSPVAAVLLFTSALAAPVFRRQSASANATSSGISDVDVLQFALTLEHLENAFYKQALQKYKEEDFRYAGASEAFYQNLLFVVQDEQDHVVLLEGAISAAGATPVKACTYQFGYQDVLSFVQLASVLENVGTSAYIGASGLISSKATLSVAASILAIEGFHTSFQRFILGEIAVASAETTPLGVNAVFTIASNFITACPPDNAPLKAQAFKQLQAKPSDGPIHEGYRAQFTVQDAVQGPVFVTFLGGLTVTSVDAEVQDKTITAAVPAGLSGQVYAVLTSSKQSGSLQDSAVIAGPAILEVEPQPPQIDFNIQ